MAADTSKDASEVEGSLHSSKNKPAVPQKSLRFSFVPLQGENEKKIVFKIPERTDIKSAINYLENKNAAIAREDTGILSSMFGAAKLPSGKCLKTGDSTQTFVQEIPLT
jgi:hypothetical protein